MNKRVLMKVAKGKLTPNEAYSLLYNEKPNKGNYLKLRLLIKENMIVSRFVNALFFFPLPLWLIKGIMIRELKKNDLPVEMYDLIRKYSGGTSIIVKNEEVKIKIVII
jgi:hypothetical protein